MTKILKEFGIRKLWIITILAMADVLAMALPFYLKNVFPNIHAQLGVQESQLTTASAIYGYVSLATYLLGGWLADKTSLKLLLITGLAAIGVVGIWYGFIPIMDASQDNKFIQLIFIFLIWGFATNFIFWSPLWKLLSQQGTENQQGTVNGLLGSINGLFGAFIIGIAYAAYYGLKSTSNENVLNMGFPVLAWIISGSALVVCGLIAIFVKEKKLEFTKNQENYESVFTTLLRVLKNYKVWLLSLLIMGVYMFQTGLSFFIPYLSNSLKIATGVTLVLGIVRTYLLRFGMSSYAGRLADKSKRYVLFLVIGLAINTLIITLAIVIPGFGGAKGFDKLSIWYQWIVQILVSGAFLALGLVSWALVTNRWATINEMKIDQRSYATAVGFISFLAFSPDSWFFHISSIVQANHKIPKIVDGKQEIINGKPITITSQTGNQIILGMVMIVAAVGLIAGIILLIIKRRESKRQIFAKSVQPVISG